MTCCYRGLPYTPTKPLSCSCLKANPHSIPDFLTLSLIHTHTDMLGSSHFGLEVILLGPWFSILDLIRGSSKQPHHLNQITRLKKGMETLQKWKSEGTLHPYTSLQVSISHMVLRLTVIFNCIMEYSRVQYYHGNVASGDETSIHAAMRGCVFI